MFLEMGIWNSNQIRISTCLTRDEVRWTYNQMIYQMDDCFQGALMDEKDIAREVLVLVKEGFGRAMLNLTKKF